MTVQVIFGFCPVKYGDCRSCNIRDVCADISKEFLSNMLCRIFLRREDEEKVISQILSEIKRTFRRVNIPVRRRR